MSAAPPRGGPGAAADLAALAADLRAVDVAAIDALLGPVAAGALGREQPALALEVTERALAQGDPVAAVVRAFLLGAPVPRRALDRAVPQTGVAGLTRLGLVQTAGQGDADPVVPLVDLRPVAVDAASLWVASDRTPGGVLAPDHVLGVGGASLSLAGFTVREPCRRVLDLGTGSGIQALLAARHADSVVATDVSARALAFAEFNAALAGVDLDLRAGSLLEPVAGEEFDLVVSNPPFVITPRALVAGDDVPAHAGPADSLPAHSLPAYSLPAHSLPAYTYRDGGLAGDALVADLVTGLGQVLAPGGVGQLLANWEHWRGEGWTERVGGWLAVSGLDGWVIQREVLDPAEYAELWLRDGGLSRERDAGAWDAGIAAWVADLDARGVEAIGLGLVTLRRSHGAPTLRRLEEHTGALVGPLGPHVAAALAAHDLLARTDDAALAGWHLRVAPDVTEERHQRPGAPGPEVILLRQGGGFARVVGAGTALAGLVGACDGELALGALLGGLAAVLEVPADALAAELYPAVRDLVADGFLLVG